MTETRGAVSPARPGLALTLLGAAHPAPALAVTVLAGLLAVALELPPDRAVLVVAAVLSGQLSIGWSNDLLDLRRDRLVGRSDKPLATGALPVGAARTACVVALVVTVPLALALGAAAGAVQLVGTAAGWAYNLGVKATVWSWLPYVVCFGGLPVAVSLARPAHPLPPAWLPVVGALLGVGAHLLNALPDLADDVATGVRGLPHRLGARRTTLAAVVLLAAGSVVAVVGSGVALGPGGVALVLVAGLALTALRGAGRGPFLAAVGIAVVDVLLLVGAS